MKACSLPGPTGTFTWLPAVNARLIAVSNGDIGSGCDAARLAINLPALSRMPRRSCAQSNKFCKEGRGG